MTQAQRWPQGRNTTPTSPSMQILQVRCSLRRAFSDSRSTFLVSFSSPSKGIDWNFSSTAAISTDGLDGALALPLGGCCCAGAHGCCWRSSTTIICLVKTHTNAIVLAANKVPCALVVFVTVAFTQIAQLYVAAVVYAQTSW